MSIDRKSGNTMKLLRPAVVILLLCTAVCCSVVSMSAQGASYLLGDADGDRKVSVTDATAIQKCLAEFEGYGIPEGTPEFLSADTNHSGNITISDATNIQRYVAQLYPEGETDIGTLIDLPDETVPVIIPVTETPIVPTTNGYETPKIPL